MKHFTFYQDIPLMKILTPNGLKKLRSEKTIYCLVKPILKKLMTWAMRSWETVIFFKKQVLKKFLPTLSKIPQFHLISWCGNFVERHSLPKFCAIRPKLCGNCILPQSCHTRKLSEITVFFALWVKTFSTLVFRNKKCQSLMTLFLTSQIFWEQG